MYWFKLLHSYTYALLLNILLEEQVLFSNNQVGDCWDIMFILKHSFNILNFEGRRWFLIFGKVIFV